MNGPTICFICDLPIRDDQKSVATPTGPVHWWQCASRLIFGQAAELAGLRARIAELEESVRWRDSHEELPAGLGLCELGIIRLNDASFLWRRVGLLPTNEKGGA